MSSQPISLTDLKAKRPSDEDAQIIPDRIRREFRDDLADGLIAIHNAADALIEIAAAALARQEAEVFLQETRLAWRPHLDDSMLRTARIRRDRAIDRFHAALAKVQP